MFSSTASFEIHNLSFIHKYVNIFQNISGSVPLFCTILPSTATVPADVLWLRISSPSFLLWMAALVLGGLVLLSSKLNPL